MITQIQTPYHLMPLTASIVKPTETIGSSGVPEWVYTETAVSVACNLQPINARDAMQYGRETGTVLADCWLAPVDTSGSAVTLTDAQLKNAKVTISSVVWRVIGTKRDLCSNGSVWHLVLERDF